jgi:hypothetical protein
MANPTGKGGFGDRPQDINREGLNRRSRETWQATVKRITDMTQEEAIAYVGGPKTKLGKLLKEIPPGLPLKDALVFISVIQYGRDPNPRMLSTLMDREEGKPNQPVSGKDGGPLEVIFTYAENGNNPTVVTPETDTNQGGEETS